MTEVHLEDTQLKKSTIKSTQQVYTPLDSSLLGREGLTPFTLPDQICCIFTDEGNNDNWRKRIYEYGI
jgi:DeoR/GlpR family transcriptional regulator of sugar metabolism